MRFWLGTHEVSWLGRTDVDLFISRRRLMRQKTLPAALGEWALDSGGFTELNLYGEWQTTAVEYVEQVRRFESEIGNLSWVAPQDWMCEPFMLEKTGLTIEEHQMRTALNFEQLRYALGDLVIPVLQGWTRDDYLQHWELYDALHFPLENEPLVGLGSVCRRQNTSEAGMIVRSLSELQLHYFGAKLTGLESFSDVLASADSLAWSYRARNDHPLAGCTHKSCSNCMRYAIRWRDQLVARLGQQRLEV
jgi:hypothetical protein